ncbi:head-tail connector protein [Gordonia phage Herod]|uniref:Uncharacterized protein n=7 Tax=Nymphadoravirus TaxID=2169636 RepID=A0A142KAN3_9CAUD|nr:head-tail connector protein [Gordonia phage Nymphadora]YP_010652790.1 head-tail connector protein [Gordonia phage Bosnia]YP_010652872.1 head-tail connector protein [Gordonia phage Herod]YP_010653200.1 head-tail connector protein [Gordonia phage BoyNamedSue]AOE43919.1 hypothetical protein SEA_BATSTARR_7 [Gordonia phage BatStarr]QDP43288.1 hypothetical protein SEA_EVIARTO_7 [Gordonia phage Eviarto]QDP43370.1 hypothetical protein SEA_TIMTAM_7 [Gordonia phage TimTam]QYW01033.1 hypothetical pr
MTVLRAREAFACSDAHGTPRVVRPGDLFDSTDPLVTGRETLFEPVEVATQRSEAVVAGGSSVESATAAPGEKRSVSPKVTTPEPKTAAATPEPKPAATRPTKSAATSSQKGASGA